jgi:hypothetical protein
MANANTRRSKAKTANISQSTPQRLKRTIQLKPKPKLKVKGKKVRKATPLESEGEEDEEDHGGDSQSDAN